MKIESDKLDIQIPEVYDIQIRIHSTEYNRLFGTFPTDEVRIYGNVDHQIITLSSPKKLSNKKDEKKEDNNVSISTEWRINDDKRNVNVKIRLRSNVDMIFPSKYFSCFCKPYLLSKKHYIYLNIKQDQPILINYNLEEYKKYSFINSFIAAKMDDNIE